MSPGVSESLPARVDPVMVTLDPFKDLPKRSKELLLVTLRCLFTF